MAATLPQLLDTIAARQGDAVALWYGAGSRSWADLAAESRRVAGGLARLGIGVDDRVALWLPNGPAWLTLLFGIARRGAVAFAVNTRFRQREMADVLGRSRVRALVLWPGFKGLGFLDILAATDPAALARIDTVVLYDEGEAAPALPAVLAHARIVRYADLASAPGQAANLAAPGMGVAAFTTSGTTSAPKFVLHPHRSITAHAPLAARALGFADAGSATLQALPFCGVFGFCQAMASIAAAAPMAVQPFFDPTGALAAIGRHRLTATNATDDMLERLLAEDPLGRRLGGLRRCGFAAFKAPERSDLVAACDRFGTSLVGLYGMSEVQALYAAQPADAAAVVRVRAGGVPVSPDASVRIRAIDGDALLPDGEAGLIEASGPSLMAEYLDDPAATAAAFTEDGFLRTGDIGHREADGSFVYLTRSGDVLRLQGFLVSPREIEAFLEDEAAVDRAQVVAAEGPDGRRAVAFVTLHPGAALAEAELTARARAALASYKVPARIVAVDAFPMTESANGMKIQRAKLREAAARLLRAG
ncbi:MAG: AMP-binding protein [Alphaproteobacteria bacterium]|nr:AMP-binding protein [Alphaproteobacteria bacterium]